MLKRFRDKYPKVRLHLHQGNSEQIAELTSTDRIDLAIATGASDIFAGLVRLPCYRWHRAIVVPHGHPLGEMPKPSRLVQDAESSDSQEAVDREFAGVKIPFLR